MYTLIAENENGERLRMTDNPAFDILDIAGTNPPPANINTIDLANVDGSVFNSSKVNQRNIVITLNLQPPIEANRLLLYSFFRVKRYIKLYYKNAHRDVYTTGYVETFENNPFSMLQQPVISIICPFPFWMSNTQTSVRFSSSVGLFEFPFAIPSIGIPFSTRLESAQATVDVGEIETGGIIELIASGEVVNPVFYDLTTNQFFGVDVTMQQYDIITINTSAGQKSVTLTRAGIKTNLLGSRKEGSTWVQFRQGKNTLSYDASSGGSNLDCIVSFTRKFEGV